MISKHTTDLKRLSFQEIQDGFTDLDMVKVNLVGRSHEQYVTLERYLKSSGSLGMTRAFLYNELGLSLLFTGNGYTLTETGQVGLREYLTPNRPLTELQGHHLIDLPITLEEFLEKAK